MIDDIARQHAIYRNYVDENGKFRSEYDIAAKREAWQAWAEYARLFLAAARDGSGESK